ncbi:hypothetical protein VKI21_12505 [Cyanobacterium aponinum UTEX 3222]|uniref:hypothetical protein n=1 Tax=Cyanobacterium aponinum TaxID=379064 RepID=UPI00308C1FE0|nr:hypothetical protein VKI21_12505 [Cyanobacterium aponinum UTEX 3222]
MTILSTKSVRDLIGINSYERAIVWSACTLLSAKNTQSETYDKNFSIFADQETSQILISFGMPLNMSLFWASMGDPDLALEEITPLEITYEGEYLPINNPLEEEPLSVNTLEKYFVWSSKKLLEYYLKNDTEKASNINLSTDLKKTAMFVVVNLDYDPIIYAESDSLLRAVIVTSTQDLPTSSTSLIGNNNLIGNNLLIGN